MLFRSGIGVVSELVFQQLDDSQLLFVGPADLGLIGRPIRAFDRGFGYNIEIHLKIPLLIRSGRAFAGKAGHCRDSGKYELPSLFRYSGILANFSGEGE